MPFTCEVRHEDAREFIHVCVEGMLSEREFAQLEADAMAAARQLGGNHLSLADLLRADIQPLEIIKLTRSMFERSDAPARKVAFVVRGKLEAAQASLLEVRPTMHLFSDLRTAERWLFADEPGRPADAKMI